MRGRGSARKLICLMNGIDKIVNLIVEESLETPGTDKVGRIFNVMQLVERKIMDLMRDIRCEERNMPQEKV